MSLLITLTIASIAGYLRMTVTEEIEAIFAGLVACLCIVLSLIFAPFLLKLTLLAVLLIIRELPDIKSKIMMLASCFPQMPCTSKLILGLTQRPEVWLSEDALYSRSSLATTQADSQRPARV